MKHWKKFLAVVLVLAIGYFLIFHWDRFLSDFYPLDKATVSPNLLASVIQWAVILIAAYLLYPPVRRAIDNFTKRHVEDLKAHVSAEQALVHAKMDHIIKHHPDIPDFEQNTNSAAPDTGVAV